jgi:hypothetical protein
VRQYRFKYKVTMWIEAGGKESFERDFVNLYRTLYRHHSSAAKEAVSVDDSVIGVKSWFFLDAMARG